MNDETGDLVYTAWTIIANAGRGDWSSESPDWEEAATRWRDRFHAWIGSDGEASLPRPEEDGK